MGLPLSPLSHICEQVRIFVHTLGQVAPPPEWDVIVTIGAPGANRAAQRTGNVLNLFFYRFEPWSFQPDAGLGDTRWIRVHCLITAFGEEAESTATDGSAGLNELSMLSRVMQLFDEVPVLSIPGQRSGERWHVQFIPRRLEDEQINQVWSAQGDTVYRPSLAYELALAPVVPEKPTEKAPRVASVRVAPSAPAIAGEDQVAFSPDGPRGVPTVVRVDTSRPRWVPGVLLAIDRDGRREVGYSIQTEVPVTGGRADFSALSDVRLWIAGDPAAPLFVVGEWWAAGTGGTNERAWSPIPERSVSAAAAVLDVSNSSIGTGVPLSDLASALDRDAEYWQLQLFVERRLRFDSDRGWIDAGADDVGLVLRSNPVLVAIRRREP